MQIVSTHPPTAQSHPRERGAALITVLLISMLLLAAGGTLIAVTARSAANAADATAESQAFYAAEAGLQGVLAVLRGNVAPHPLFDATPSAPLNKITFRKAITSASSNASGTGTPKLSRWLTYDTTFADRVVLSPNYTPMSGMAYTVEEIKDPDFSDIVTFSVAGAFSTNNCSSSPNPCINLGNSGSGFTLTYTPRPSTTVSTTGASATSTLGQLTISSVNGSTTITNVPFDLTITQTGPWASTTKISGKLNGNVSRTGSTITSALIFTYSQLTYSLSGVEYSVPVLLQTIGTTATTLPVTIKAPEPQRLLVKVKGLGPRNAVKHMQMLVGRFGFSYAPKGAITLRSHDDSATLATFLAGNSQPFSYNGNDKSGGAALPAFSVTHTPDLNNITAITNGAITNNQLLGSSPIRQVPINELSDFLQSVGAANAMLNNLRVTAKNQKWPSTCTGAPTACDRYFGPGETPADLGGSQTNGLLTFVDGDLTIGASTNGAGLLVVTGTLKVVGAANFNGLMLVIGEGKIERDGGGNGTSLGALAIAKLGSSEFLNPHFETKGAGNSGYQYDSEWVRKALMAAGLSVQGVSEY